MKESSSCLARQSSLLIQRVTVTISMHRFTRNFGISCSREFSPRKTQAARPAASHFLTNTRNPNENNANFASPTKSISDRSPTCRQKHEHNSQTAGRISVVNLPFCSLEHILSKEHIVIGTDRRPPKIFNEIPRTLIEKILHPPSCVSYSFLLHMQCLLACCVRFFHGS